jgi:4-amino-4-deoxy-L-arabinose transferase-like glycosyltransferase
MRHLSFVTRIWTYLWQERLPLLIILGCFIFSGFLVSPLRNVPLIDDWTYVWSVENLIKTGHLAVPDWNGHYPILQTLLGSLVSLLFGFSFGVLRVLTVSLAIVGCMALYLTLRELELDRERSLLGALTLAVNPVFFCLSFSFMTDVPFLSMMTIALLFYVAGTRRESQALLWLGGLFAVAAFLSRQIGFIIPLVLVPCLVQRETGQPGWRKKLMPLAASLSVIGILWLWIWKSLGSTSVIAKKVEEMRYLFLISPGEYLDFNIGLLLNVTFAVFPLLIAGIVFRPRWWPLAVALLTIGGALLLRIHFGEVPYPISDRGTWSLQELGDVRALIQGSLTAPGPLDRFSLPIRALMLTSVSILAAGTLRLSIKARGRMSQPTMILMTIGLLQFILINALWFYHDRYYLVLLPSLIFLSLKLTAKTGFSRSVALSGILMLGFVSVSGTWDALRFNQACLEAFHYLRSAGAPVAEIDAGYSITGWMLYAHPENLPSGADPAEDVPWITSNEKLPYVISNTPLPGYEVLKEFSWNGSLWAVSNTVYALHKQDSGVNTVP